MIRRFHIDVCGGDGTHRAEVVIDGAGKRHLGIYRFVLADGTDAVEPDTPTWDCREWQWWAGYDGSTEMRPRMVPAACGGEELGGVARVWSEYRCDGVRTRHEWTVLAVQEPPRLGYDCTMTVTNETGIGACRVRAILRLLHQPQPAGRPAADAGDRDRLPVLGCFRRARQLPGHRRLPHRPSDRRAGQPLS